MSLFCSIIDGDQPILISWQKDGREITGAASKGIDITHGAPPHHDSILRINKLKSQHKGNYSCLAANPAGSTSINYILQVEGR